MSNVISGDAIIKGAHLLKVPLYYMTLQIHAQHDLHYRKIPLRAPITSMQYVVLISKHLSLSTTAMDKYVEMYQEGTETHKLYITNSEASN